MKNHNRFLAAHVALAITLFGPATAHADPVDATRHFCTFSPSDLANSPAMGPIQTNGSAGVMGTTLSLTQGVSFQTASAFYKEPLSFEGGRPFHTFFSFTIEPNAAGGNGLTFLLQNNSAQSLGSNDDGLGYGGISTSIIFEFDTHQDLNPLPGSQHVSFMLNGDQNTHYTTVTSGLVELVEGGPVYAWIDYDGVDRIDLFLSKQKMKPAEPVTWMTLQGNPPQSPTDFNIAQWLSPLSQMPQGYAGFTAATGTKVNNHQITSWELSNEGVPCECQGDDACKGFAATPVCSLVKKDQKTLCVECTSNDKSRCTGVKTLCHSELEVCVECEKSLDCGVEQPVCDPATYTCNPCVTDADCEGRPETPYCETTGSDAGHCVKCKEADGCGGAGGGGGAGGAGGGAGGTGGEGGGAGAGGVPNFDIIEGGGGACSLPAKPTQGGVALLLGALAATAGVIRRRRGNRG